MWLQTRNYAQPLKCAVLLEGLYLPRDRPIGSGEPTSLERNKTSGPHTCNSLLPFRTIQNADPKQSHPDQPINVETKLLSSQHLFQYEAGKPRCLTGPVPFQDFPGVRPCPATVETDWCGLSANAKKRQGCPAQRFGQVRLKIEAGSVC